MPELEPIARSPIAPAAPIAQRDGWEISGARSSARLRIVDCAPLAKLAVRASAQGATARLLGAAPGRALRDAQGALVASPAPGEWMVLAAPGSAAEVRRRIEQAAADEFASVVDLTHGRALVRLVGASAPALLAKLCAIDFDDRVTPNGAALRSSLAKLVTDLIRDDCDAVPSYLLHCEWSSGQYLFDSLLDAGGEFGIEVDGFRTPGA